MTKYKILIFAFLPLFLFGDCADCDAYKTQVVNDCNALDSSLQQVANNVNSASGFATSGYNSSTDANDKAIFATIMAILANTQGHIDSVSDFVSSIRSTAQSLQCNASSNTVGSCDCAQYLQTLISLLQTCNQTVASVKSGMDSVLSSLGSTSDGDSDIVSTLNTIRRSFEDFSFMVNAFIGNDDGDIEYNVSDFYDLFSDIGSVTNVATYLNYLITVHQLTKAEKIAMGMPSSSINDGMPTLVQPWTILLQNTGSSSAYSNYRFYDFRPTGAFGSANSWNYTSLQSLIKSFYLNSLRLQSSLNSYAYTNLFEFVALRKSSESLSSNFSIFNDFVFSSDAPLSMYTDFATDGSYHDYLTNYYIKVSKGQQSGSDNFTNWFSRIEILLASLVFQDDGTNFVDDTENTSQMENALSQSVDTLSQAVSLPQNVTGKIDNMGQSFLGLLEEWQTIVSGNSLPSQFVLCDINLGSQSRDSSNGSSISSFRLETSLDSGDFRQFLDFCHAITTILFTMLFVWLSVMLLSFLLASLAKLAQFCYLVYSALFGG